MLEANLLHIGYKKSLLTKPVNGSWKKGDVVVILGDNGVGKSTFLKTLANLQKPISGTVKLTTNRIGWVDSSILKGVYFNLKKIDLILKSSLKDKSKVQSFDKLLLSIFRCAIYEIEVKKEISKKIVISEYLLISNHFFGNKEATLLNGVLDNLR
mgnify:CR=1 FL=1